MATRKTKTTKLVSRKTKCRYVTIKEIQAKTKLRISNESESKKFKALKNSIGAQGIIAPIVVKLNDDETYTIIDGERRFHVAKELGYKKLKVAIYEELDDSEELLGIVSNSNQKVLTPIELGIAYKRLIDRGVYENKASLARALGISEGTVGTKIKNLEMDSRIIEKLIEGEGIKDQKVLKSIRIFEMVDTNGVSESQWRLFSHIVDNGLGRKEALEYIKSQREPEIVSERTVQLSGDNIVNLHIDMEQLEDDKKERMAELLAEIQSLQKEALAA